MKDFYVKYIRNLNLEAFIWLGGLIVLYFMKVDGNHCITICPFKNLGIDFCPGCGLGRSIHYLMHFELIKSFNAHPLGIFAFVVIVRRIYILMHNSIKQLNISVEKIN